MDQTGLELRCATEIQLQTIKNMLIADTQASPVLAEELPCGGGDCVW